MLFAKLLWWPLFSTDRILGRLDQLRVGVAVGAWKYGIYIFVPT